MPIDYFDDVDFCLSTGSLLFLVYCDRSCCLMNPSTGKITRQQISLEALDGEDTYIMCPNYQRISKVVVSDQIVALLANDKVKFFPRGPPRGASSCSAKVWLPSGNTLTLQSSKGSFTSSLQSMVMAMFYHRSCMSSSHIAIRFLKER
jgi:hypothetical protein